MKKVLIGVCIFLTFNLLNVSAYGTSYYYETDEGKFALCGGYQPGCFEVEKNANGLSFNSSAKEVDYQGFTYSYNEEAQEAYYATKYGQTRMYFYMNGDRYVLCDQVGDCTTYTYDRLVAMGATISNQDRIILNNGDGPGVPGDTYYYNSSYEQTGNPGDSGNTETDNNEEELVDETGYCTQLKEPLQFIGNIVLIFKIVIPIIIILFGMIDFFKAVTGAKDEEIKKSARSLMMRVLAGVVIFFIPTIVSAIFSLVSDFAKIEGSFDACQKCVFNVRECK